MATFKLISSVTVGAGGAASIDFTSIPSTYTDLKLVVSGRFNSSALSTTLWWRMGNGSVDTGANYSAKYLRGDGASAASSGVSAQTYALAGEVNGNTSTTNTFCNLEIYIPNYTSSSGKSFSSDIVQESNGTTSYATLTAGLWSGTSAINVISLGGNNGGANWMQYSTAYLYGISKS